MLKKIKDIGLTQRKVNGNKAAKELKATSAVKIDKSGSPAALFAIRRDIVETFLIHKELNAELKRENR